jgi:hypothetical protein
VRRGKPLHVLLRTTSLRSDAKTRSNSRITREKTERKWA